MSEGRGRPGLEPGDPLEEALISNIVGLRRYSRALLGSPIDAEDLVQETLVRALAKIKPWTQIADLRSYLFTILHNLYVDQYRKRRNAPAMVDLDNVVQHPSIPANQDRRLEIRDLERGLKELSPEQREVVLLVALEGLSYAQVAEVAGIPIGTVMSRLSRARGHLRDFMQNQKVTRRPSSTESFERKTP